MTNFSDFLPPEAVDLLKVIKHEGVQQAWIRIAPYIAGATCPVCNDGRFVSVCYPVSGPFESVPSLYGPDFIVEFHNEHYYTCKKQTFPCHACNARSFIQEIYWEESGLLPQERDWKLSYYTKLDKDLPVMSLNQWLSEIPRIDGMKILYGPYGMGKSGMGKAMVAACIRAGVRAHYFAAEDFLRLCRGSFKPSGMAEEAIFEQYLSYRFLVVDEVDPERVSETSYGKAALFGLLNKRYDMRDNMATLLISNKEPDALWDYLASRMEDAERIPVSGINLRGRGEPELISWMDKE